MVKKANGNGNGNGNGRSRPAPKKRPFPSNGNGRSRRRGRVTQPLRSAAIMNMNGNFRPVRNATQTMQGSDFLSIVEVKPAPTASERILAVIDISPSMFPGTRLTQMSQLYERYRFTNFRIRYVPAVPTTVACQLLVYLDTDPTDDPSSATTAEILIRQATAHTGSQQWNFNVPKLIPLPMRADRTLYYTGDTKLNPRFNLQARAFIVQVTDPVNFNGEPVLNNLQAGSLYIDWVCLFQTPQINPAGFASGGIESVKLAFPDPDASGLVQYPQSEPEELPLTLTPNAQYLVWSSQDQQQRVTSSTSFSGSGSDTFQFTFFPNGGLRPPTAQTPATLKVVSSTNLGSIFNDDLFSLATFTTDSQGKAQYIRSSDQPSATVTIRDGGFVLNFARVG